MNKTKFILLLIIKHSKFGRKLLGFLFPHNPFIKKKLMEKNIWKNILAIITVMKVSKKENSTIWELDLKGVILTSGPILT